ncbi:S-adenosyl-L-methionine-dependent methyltransferase [Stachybotrys elegans]|uniref:S-adenosyl-L-methionine-dependent methyltransferase n=1 Tax=Stachybotrys elegans TaxID=80388 RepID=A0A8K0T111_9HYPO|nr:S-adenosyl-L-methionine-dependent methyltransferase [Stachybotrys elegans]
MSIPPEAAARLTKTFGSIPFSSHPAAWNSCWNDQFTPWDRSGPSHALADLLSQRPDLVPPAQERDARGDPIRNATGTVTKRTALVPGCGRGHDVLLLSAYGYDVWGLDTSETAIQKARDNQAAAGESKEYEVVNGMEKGAVDWIVGDFFADDWTQGIGANGTGKFDLIYDYTFLCALPLDVRPRWAKRMSELITPTGRLICLEYPSGRPLTELGPAWGVWPEVYEALLSAPGDPVEYNQDGTPIGTPSPKPRDDALHRLSLIKPRRTHKAGTNEDGSVRDFISVWSR